MRKITDRRADIGKYTAHHGPTAASRHFSKVCGHNLPKSTSSLRKFGDAVELKLHASTQG